MADGIDPWQSKDVIPTSSGMASSIDDEAQTLIDALMDSLPTSGHSALFQRTGILLLSISGIELTAHLGW